MLYVALGKLLGSATKKGGILFCISLRFRRLQNIEWEKDQMPMPEESI
jgi:hypothetical protein